MWERFCRLGLLLFAAWCLPHWAECASNEKATEKKAGRVGWHIPPIAFQMSGKKWEDVIQYLVDKSGEPFRSDLKLPGGTFTFTPPEGKRFSLIEIYDIINEDLQTNHKLHLVRGEALILVPLNANIPPKLVDKVALSDLKKRGRTEFVILDVAPLLEVSAQEIKKELGEFSEVTLRKNSKNLTVQARVGDLQRVFVREIEKADAESKAKTQSK